MPLEDRGRASDTFQLLILLPLMCIKGGSRSSPACTHAPHPLSTSDIYCHPQTATNTIELCGFSVAELVLIYSCQIKRVMNC